MEESKGVVDFLAKTRAKPPARMLTDWFPRLDIHGGVALDLGCGAGGEAEYLAKEGMMVDAIDKSETVAKAARERCQGLTVDVIQGDFREFQLRPDYYTLAVSVNALPFVKKDDCAVLLKSVQASIRPGGAVVFAVFGPEHAWAKREDMSFWTIDEFRDLWAGWDVIAMNEFKGISPLASGTEIFQHRIQLIAKKTLLEARKT
ncbi:MAG: class I SAM-dependent methyltransferase [Patescibacteria group bacterium]